MIKRAVIALLLVLLLASAAPAREFEGVDMPETLKFDGKTVALNGVGMRKVLFIKPYVGGLYVTTAAKDGDAIMNADEPMAIRLNMIDDVGQKMMLRSLYNGMRNSMQSTGGDFKAIEGRIEQLKGYFTDEIKKGDIYEFRYLPGQGVKVAMNDQVRGTIPGADFKQAFFGIWLNSKSPADSDLREAMLAGDMRVALAKPEEEAAAKAESARLVAEAEKKAADEAAKKQQAEMELAAQAQQTAAAQASAEAEMKAAKDSAKLEADKAVAQAKALADAEKKAAAEKKAQAEAVARAEAEKKAAEMQAAIEPKAAEVVTAAAEPVKAVAAVAAVAEPVKAVEAVATKKIAAVIPAQETPAASAIITAQEFESQGVYFEASKTTLGPIGRKNVDGKIAWLKANPTAKVVVEIQADSQSQNEQRADSIINYMKAAGIESSRMEKKVSEEVSSTGPASRTAHLRLVQ